MNSINTNLSALETANRLSSHYGRLSTSVARLSSGLRINSAADDAAGLAIRELMRSDVAAFFQGVRNANDAISLLEVADGALAIIDEKLIRMKELAEQAATGTYNSTQRLMINSEFQAMASEIDRIANATDFNGIKLLDGTLTGDHDGSGLVSKGKMKIHFGAANDSAEDYYYVEIADCSTTGLGLRKEAMQVTPGYYKWLKGAKIDKDNMTLDFVIQGGTAGYGESAFMTGLDYFALPTGLKEVSIASNASKAAPFHKTHVCLFDKDGMQYTGPPIMETTWSPITSASGTHKSGVTANWWNNISAADFLALGIEKGVFNADVTALVKSPDHDTLMNANNNYAEISAFGANLSTDTGINEIGATTLSTGGATTEERYIIDELNGEVLFFIGGHDNPGGGCNTYTLSIQAKITPDFLKFYNNLPDDEAFIPGSMVSVETQQKAQETLVTIQDAIIHKDKIRAHLGALQNRLENTATVLTIQSENLQAAESRISDADVATEMTIFVRNQILTQSAVAMLGQANSYPHMLLGLLQG